MAQTCYRHPSHSAGVTCQRCEKPICPSCMVTASVGFHCPECSGVKREGRPQISKRRIPASRKARPEFRKARSGFQQRHPAPVTVGIILINVAVYIFSIRAWGGVNSGSDYSSPGSIEFDYGLRIDIFGNGSDWWRIFTVGFIHSGFFHIFFNMLLIWFIGRQLEYRLGSLKFTMLYLCSIIASSFAILWISENNSVTVGASGGVYGIMGAYVIMSKFHTGRFFNSIISIILALNIGFSIFSAILNSSSNVSNEGHIGGLLAGALIGFLYTYIYAYLKKSSKKKWLSTYAVYSLPVIIGGALFWGGLLVA